MSDKPKTYQGDLAHLPAALLPRCLVLATSFIVTLTQLALPLAVEGGLEDSMVLWAFSVALGLAYMLNCDVLRPAQPTESDAA